MPERIAVIGVGETEAKSRWPEISVVELINLATKRALENAQLTIKDIDVVIMGNMEIFEQHMPDLWGIEGNGGYLKSGMKIQTGGSSGATACATAFDHAASGLFRAVLVIGFEKQGETGGQYPFYDVSDDTFFNIGAGGLGAAPGMAERALDMLQKKSVTEEQIARLRVKESECGSRNPHAHLRRKLTVEDVMNSPYIIPPLRLLHMCPTSEAACAMIVAPESVAKKVSPNPAWVADWVTVHGGTQRLMGHFSIYLQDGPLGAFWSWGLEQTSTKLYKRNGITNPRKELDVIELYDMSTWHEARFYEDMHLCGENECGKLIDEWATWPDGDIPVNPSGGVVCTNAIGQSAMARIAEAAVQVRGDGGERQVPNVKTAMGNGIGGDNYCTAALYKKSLV